RYNVVGYHKTGIDFVPASQSWGVISADPVAQYGERAAREMQYLPLKSRSQAFQKFFNNVHLRWALNFHEYVWATAIPMFLAWFVAILGPLCWLIPRARPCPGLAYTGLDKLIAPIVAASALLLYQDMAIAMFVQPMYRYFHLTEPLRLVIGGFGLAFA